ncbi:MAG: CocE/NonD family hydrolase [Betaproteobacteria bacterium]|nr:MAG: CocE/NonD family hydrolase [Betaproteobacteria bacterium]
MSQSSERTARSSAASVYDVVCESNVMVPMRDGVRLATDIHRPALGDEPVNGAFPVILERTPYGKALASRSELDRGETEARSRADIARWFVQHGYVVVYQDCRGRYGSEGHFVKYLSDGEDGCDTIEWIARQPWCDGRVATMGLSYAAHTQVAAACLAPKALAAMVVDCGGFSNAYRSGIRNGGAFEMKQVTWAFNQARESPQAKADPVVRAALAQENLRDWFRAMPWKPGHSPVRYVPEYEDYLFEQWTQGSFGAYWKQLGIYTEGWHERFADVPQIHMSSWYDAYVPTALENYVGIKAGKRGPVRLIMGPWTHGDRSKSWSGDVDFGPASIIDGNVAAHWRELRLRWFDHWLKHELNGVDREPTVRLFLMGGGSERRNAEGRMDHGGRWIAGDDWPLPQTRFVPYYLHGDGRLSPALPETDAAPMSYDYDPDDPVPTIGGPLTSGQPVFEGGAFDQREDLRFFGCTRPGLPLAARRDVLVFETAPLAEDMAVIGPLRIVLNVSSSCVDTDFTAKLIDVHPGNPDYPRGYAMNLADGILRLRYRDSWERPALMTPGEVYEITIEPYATCNLFKAGHRIRLDISSSNFPRYDLNYNTGEPEGMARRKQIALNTVYVDRARASHIVLPLVPVSSLRML